MVQTDDPSKVLFSPNCYTLSADGTFDDPGFPAPGTWESGWDGEQASYVAEAETDAGLVLVQDGEVTVDEATGDLLLSAESTATADGEIVISVTSTGKAVDACTSVPA